MPGGLDVEKMSVDIALWGLYIRACGTGRVSPEEPGMPGPVECLMPRPCASESGVEIELPSMRVAGVWDGFLELDSGAKPSRGDFKNLNDRILFNLGLDFFISPPLCCASNFLDEPSTSMERDLRRNMLESPSKIDR